MEFCKAAGLTGWAATGLTNDQNFEISEMVVSTKVTIDVRIEYGDTLEGHRFPKSAHANRVVNFGTVAVFLE